ncbi:Tat proofreading chaperone DmsD [Uliginosibacterium sp. sgz301328]|uniref:Tat proofreading chaperone DmsD n=1 Tax=Uliginosibacterium sp. sgz301328 TaxID=3243764 RepID=UPI00359EF52D
MTQTIDTTDISASCRILGALFYLSPADASVQPFLGFLAEHALPEAWPFGASLELERVQTLMAQDLDRDRLARAYQRLFIGPDHLEAPPWGSVYMSEDSTLCADSLLDLRAFFAAEQVRLDMRLNEPEDHIGLLFWAIAWLADQQSPAAISALLDKHMLPWSNTYFSRLAMAAEHPFYVGLSQLASLTLDAISDAVAQAQ